jgi:hypothetical protein
MGGFGDGTGLDGRGGNIVLHNPTGMGGITLGEVLATGRINGTITFDAPSVRFIDDLPLDKINFAGNAPTSISLATTASIQMAIDIAAIGATITLDAGTFIEHGILIDKRVNIVGAGKDPTTGTVIVAVDGSTGFLGRGDSLQGIVVSVGGVNATNTLLLQGFTVENAARNGIVLDRGGSTGNIGFIALNNIQSTMNGSDGLAVIGTGTATNLTLTNTMLTGNRSDGLSIEGGTVRRLTIGSSMLDSNDLNGMLVQNATLSDVLIQTGSTLSNNGIDGIEIVGGLIAPQFGVKGSFGFIVSSSFINENGLDGVSIQGFTPGGLAPIPLSGSQVRAQVRDLTFDSTRVILNGRDGIRLIDSDVADLAIQNSFVNNNLNGFHADGSNFTGVAFVGSTFADGSAPFVGQGVLFSRGRIDPGPVTLRDLSVINTGFTFRNSRALGDGNIGVEFDGVTAKDVTFMNAEIVENNFDGVLIFDSNTGDSFASNFADLVIQDSALGRAIDPDDGHLGSNGGRGFEARDTVFSGVVFRRSSFNGNGNDGVLFLNSTINSGTATFLDPKMKLKPLQTGFTLQDSQVVGNALNGVEFVGVTATDVTFNNALIAENGINGVFIHNTEASTSRFTDLAVQNSHLGTASNGTGFFFGNAGSGFAASETVFTGVAFLGSFFDGNGASGSAGGPADGIVFTRTIIQSGLVTPTKPSKSLTTGFTLSGSEVRQNTADGVRFTDDTVTGVTITTSNISANRGDGVQFTNSLATGVTINNSDINSNARNGVLFDGLRVIGFTFTNARVQNNISDGVRIQCLVDDVTFTNSTLIQGNGDTGIRIIVNGVPSTDGSILFGKVSLANNPRGILVGAAEPLLPVLLTFLNTQISGGVNGLILQGAGIRLTGGGGAIPGGSSVGGGLMPGDGHFGGSLGTLTLSGQTGDFIRLQDGALFNPGTPTVINASKVKFNGVVGSSLSSTQLQTVRNKVIEFNDNNSLGLIFLQRPPAVPR